MHIVHGIPNNTPLKSGDVISVDCGAYKMDIMEIMRIPLRLVSRPRLKLLQVTKESLYVGIREFKEIV
jgi:methionyl aminopeptidase